MIGKNTATDDDWGTGNNFFENLTGLNRSISLTNKNVPDSEYIWVAGQNEGTDYPTLTTRK